MVACFRLGAVALPCNEQLRSHDLDQRLTRGAGACVLADERDLGELTRAQPTAPCSRSPTRRCSSTARKPDLLDRSSSRREDPCLITFTSGTTGEAKGIVHGQRYLFGQRLQAELWLGARPATCLVHRRQRLVEVGPQRVHRAVADGAAALLHDARFDPRSGSRSWRERVNVLCMAPTEYRVIAKRATLRPFPALRGLIAAGEALNPEVLRAFREATGLEIRDGYGQTETGQLTAMPLGRPHVRVRWACRCRCRPGDR